MHLSWILLLGVTGDCRQGGNQAVVSPEGSMGGGPTSKFIYVVVGGIQLLADCSTEGLGSLLAVGQRRQFLCLRTAHNMAVAFL